MQIVMSANPARAVRVDSRREHKNEAEQAQRSHRHCNSVPYPHILQCDHTLHGLRVRHTHYCRNIRFGFAEPVRLLVVDFVCDGVRVLVFVDVCVAVPDLERVGDIVDVLLEVLTADAVLLGVECTELVRDCVGGSEPVLDGVLEGDAEFVEAGDIDDVRVEAGDCVAAGLDVGACVAADERLLVPDGVRVRVAVLVDVRALESVEVLDGVCDCEELPDGDPVIEVLGLAELEPVALLVASAVLEAVTAGDDVCVAAVV